MATRRQSLMRHLVDRIDDESEALIEEAALTMETEGRRISIIDIHRQQWLAATLSVWNH